MVFHVNSIVCLAAAILFFSACSDDGEPVQITGEDESTDVYQNDRLDDVAPSNDHDGGLANNNDENEVSERERCLEEEDFERPGENVDDYQEVIENMEGQWSSGIGSRGKVRPPVYHEPWHYWVEEGEYFVLDWNVRMYGYDWLPRKFEFMVLHEGEPVPFNVAVVEDPAEGFVSNDEIESWEEDDYDTRTTVEFGDEEVVSSSWVVSPRVFDDPGTYHLRIVSREIWEEGERVGGPWFRGMSMGNRPLNEFFHVHYGSECDLPPREGVPTRQMGDGAYLWKTWEAATFVDRMYGLFLAPPTDLYNWREYTPAFGVYDDDLQLDQVFEASDPEVTLELYVADLRLVQAQVFAPFTEETLYVVMRDGEIIEEFLLEDVPIPTPADYHGEEPAGGARVPIDVELTEEVATFQVAAIPQPFDEFDYDEMPEDSWSLEPTHATHFQARTSSAIQMRYVPD